MTLEGTEVCFGREKQVYIELLTVCLREISQQGGLDGKKVLFNVKDYEENWISLRERSSF